MVIRNVGGFEVLREQCEQQITFSAAPDSGNDFDQAVVNAINQLFEVTVPLYFYKPSPKNLILGEFRSKMA